MQKLIEDILKNDSQAYDTDYLKKINENDNYKAMIKSFSPQIGMYELFEYMRNRNLLEYLYQKIESIQDDKLFNSYIHGKNHNLRVMTYALYLADMLNLDENEKELIMLASAYHDIGRVNDEEDAIHGRRSAEKITELLPSGYKDLSMIKAVIELHSIEDSKFDEIASKYEVEDKEKFRILYSILKDADALDRVRLSYGYSSYSSLNPKMLRLEESKFLLRACHEINEYFVQNYKKKYNIILDTDMENEIDDKFALAYLLKSPDTYQIEAITIAPFQGSKYSGVLCQDDLKAGVDASFETTLKIMDMMGIENKPEVFKGSTGYLQDGYESGNDAVDKIIEICNRNEETYILSIGAITNMALAIRKCPSIAKKIKLVWLGGNSFLYGKNDEFNFRQDIAAVREAFESDVDLTIIPCVNVASDMITTIFELEHYLSGKGKIGEYLCDEYRSHKKEIDGKSKTLWDLAVIGYYINPNWYESDVFKRPTILKDGSYLLDGQSEKEATFVKRISRDGVYRDFFRKM